MPYKCRSCAKQFKTKSQCNAHEANIHGTLDGRKCVACGRKYRQMNNFVVHFKKEHLIQCDIKGCSSKTLCRGCANELDRAKKDWRIGLSSTRTVDTVCCAHISFSNKNFVIA